MRHLVLAFALVSISLAACQPTSSGENAVASLAPTNLVTLSGTALYRERIALPADARLVVTISDVSLMDVAAPVIAETEVVAEGRQVPLPFSLEYDLARIDPRGRYAVSARITDAAGQLLWVTDTHVDLPRAGETIELVLVRTGR